MSAWFSNQTIGLNAGGYGALLGEATYTSARVILPILVQLFIRSDANIFKLSAHYATMNNDYFVCVPFNMLPAEQRGKNKFFSPSVEKQKDMIRKRIIGKDDNTVFQDQEAMELLAQLGSDTNINAFALNWKHEDGTLNNDLEEANYFMKRVVDKLSITTPDTDPSTIPIFLTSTQFSFEEYGKCKQTFQRRLGVDDSHQSLFVMRNVVMSPFPTQMNFIVDLMKDLEDQIKAEVENCRKRNKADADTIRFLVQGSAEDTEVFLAFQTSFHTATRRQQLILSATLDDDLKAIYDTLSNDQSNIIVLDSDEPLDIREVVKNIGTSGFDLKAKIFEWSGKYVFA